MPSKALQHKEVMLPLAGMRVLDLCDRIGQSCGRQLADLGAEVILVEPPEGMSSRQRAPLSLGESLYFATHNANKLSVALDLTQQAGKQQFLQLVASADLLLDGSAAGYLESLDLSVVKLRSVKPELIVLSITDFGLQGPYKDFTATDAVHIAMGGVLSRSGIDGRDPLLPPGELAMETAAVQASWVALLAYWQRLHTGQGDLLDYSINDTVAQILDPGVGATGSAAAGRTAVEVALHGRPVIEYVPGKLPPLGLMYPVFKCADGYVRVCVLNPRQWQAMSKWLGPDHAFTHPKYAKVPTRLMNIGPINATIGQLLASGTRAHLVAEGRKRGIPIASVACPAELFDDQHYAARDFFTDIELANGSGRAPSGYLCMDGKRVGIRRPAPKIGQDNTELLGRAKKTAAKYGSESIARRPLEGLLVLDLGVIVAGAELGRLFADQGAKVIKVENQAFGDGLRQAFDGNPVPIPFSQGSRGKKSFGLNLRTDKGIEIFKQLAAKVDVVVSNFKPGTMQSLGIGYDDLKAINPGVICAESSAMGSDGPLAKTMGYGPLVRASTSLSSLWRYPDQEDGYGDSVTIYPDHFVARVSATAILAKLIERKKTGVGGFVDLSQAECIMNVLATEFLRESVEPGSMVAKGNQNEFDAPNSVFPCAGDDEWCVLAVSSDEQWQGLCRAMGREDLADNADYTSAAGRLANRDSLEALVTQWCAGLSPSVAMAQCQAQGVPAGNMLRLSEFIQNPHYQARNFFRVLNQPSAGRPLETENGPVAFSETLPPPKIERAPARAEHTRELAAELLGLSDDEISALVKSGDLEIGKSGAGGGRRQKLKTFAVSMAVNGMLKYHALKAEC